MAIDQVTTVGDNPDPNLIARDRRSTRNPSAPKTTGNPSHIVLPTLSALSGILDRLPQQS